MVVKPPDTSIGRLAAGHELVLRGVRPGDLIEIEREGEDRRARVLACVDSYGLEAGAVIMATPLA